MQMTPVEIFAALLQGKKIKFEDAVYSLKWYGSQCKLCVEGIRYAQSNEKKMEPRHVWLPVDMLFDDFVMRCYEPSNVEVIDEDL